MNTKAGTDVFGAAGLSDFPITSEEYIRFRDFFYQKTGVQFSEAKRYFVDKRIAERARVNGCDNFRQYFTLVRGAAAELQQLINLLTVNETYFFRENYQLEALVRSVLPQIASRKRPGDTIRIWSLPCSTGEEPYSIAISVLDSWPQSDAYQIEILASDLDTRVLADAKAGIYGERSLQHVDAAVRGRYFTRRPGNEHQIISELRESIDFFQLNLSSKIEMSRYRNIDIVFCRNLLIYFDDLSRREAVESIFESLVPGGFIFLGHSESMSRMSSLFVSRRFGDCTVYQRPAEVR
jgi:chemotaxis protein methyltransferase CheR